MLLSLRNALSIGLTSVVLLAGCTAAPRAGGGSPGGGVKTDANNGVSDTTIKIGWMGDESGPGASVELPNIHGLQAYAEFINAKGGIAGHQVQVIDLDDKFTADNGTVNFRRLVNDEKVLAIANMGGSQITTPLAPAVNTAKIPVVFPVQTVDAQMNVPYFFNVTSHYADQADVLVASAAKAVGSAAQLNLFVARLSVPSGEEFDQYVQRSLQSQGAKYAGNVTMDGTQTDFTPTVVQMKQAMEKGANAVVVHGPLSTGLGLFTAMSKASVTIPVFGINALVAPTLFQKGPSDVLSNFAAVQSVLPPNATVAGAKEIQDYLSANPKWNADGLEPYFTQGWITGSIIKQAAEKAAQDNGGTLTRATLETALSGKWDFGGLTCPLDFSANVKYTPCATAFGWDGKGLVAKQDFASFAPVLSKKYGLQ
jgi:branched-chain amino acid transport system substrate-binding protein